MPDAVKIADQISLLLKTKYAKTPRESYPFDLAFIEVMDYYGFTGEERYPLKQHVGQILGKRRRTKKAPSQPHPKLNFVTIEKTRGRIILRCPMMGDEITYRRGDDGKVMCVAHTGNPPQIALAQGAEAAESLFDELDRELIRAGTITINERSPALISMVLAEQWSVIARKGVRDIIMNARDTKTGRPVNQSEIPFSLLREARGIAHWFLFRDSATAELFT